MDKYAEYRKQYYKDKYVNDDEYRNRINETAKKYREENILNHNYNFTEINN